MPTPPAASALWCSTNALEGAPSTVIASLAAALMNRLRSVIGPIRTGSNGEVVLFKGRPGALPPHQAGAIGPRPQFYLFRDVLVPRYNRPASRSCQCSP